MTVKSLKFDPEVTYGISPKVTSFTTQPIKSKRGDVLEIGFENGAILHIFVPYEVVPEAESSVDPS